MRFLVDGPAFMDQLERDIEAARRSVAVQAMSFEGDAAGARLVDALMKRPDLERTLIVDRYSLVFVSDAFLPFPWNAAKGALWRERAATRRMARRLERDGVRVCWTNPLGLLLRKFVARNHKKLVVVDDEIGYLGGINFCDHNVSWHDMMLRFEDPEAAAFLRADVESTCRGAHSSAHGRFGDLEILCWDGRRNPEQNGPLVRLIREASRSIVAQSAYMTEPYFSFLAAAASRGVEVTLVAPKHNNKSAVTPMTEWACARGGMSLRLFDGPMSHVKAMLVDGSALVVGSSNFDYFAYHAQQEIVAIVRDQGAIDQYRREVLEPDLARSVEPDTRNPPGSQAWRDWALRRGGDLLVRLSRF